MHGFCLSVTPLMRTPLRHAFFKVNVLMVLCLGIHSMACAQEAAPRRLSIDTIDQTTNAPVVDAPLPIASEPINTPTPRSAGEPSTPPSRAGTKIKRPTTQKPNQTPPTDEVATEADNDTEVSDPYEAFNRPMFAANTAIDKVVTQPVARVYKKAVPSDVRLCTSNFFSNLGEPYTAINNLLQGKVKAAGQDIGRLLINSTLGVGGCVDVASQWGVPKHQEDFGQTLGSWGVPSGGYVVLPILGPSTVRDALTKPVDFFANPVGYVTNVPLRNTMTGYNLIRQRTELLELTDFVEEQALDPYAMIRDGWVSNRAANVTDTDGSYESTSPRRRPSRP